MQSIGASFPRSPALTDTHLLHPVRAWLVPLLVGLGAYTVAVASAFALLNDGDTLSHIVIGRWIVEHRAIPFHDPYLHLPWRDLGSARVASRDRLRRRL